MGEIHDMIHQRLVIETKDGGDTQHGSPEAGDRNKGKDDGDTRHGSPEAGDRNK